MDVDDLHPQLRHGFHRFTGSPMQSRWLTYLVRAGLAVTPAPRPPAGVRVETVRCGRHATARILRPDDGGSPVGGGRPAMVWVHGGGMVIGAAKSDDPRNAELVRALGMVVVSVDYRLAPEHPYPAAQEDCLDAWDWLLGHASELGVDIGRLVIGGQSAGGGHAAALVQRVHDRGGAQPVGQLLFEPMLDDRTAADGSLDAVGHVMWDNRRNRIGWHAYLGSAPGALRAPHHAVPARRTEMTGLPPAWIGVGDIELFYHECVAYAEALHAAGVDITLEVVPGAPHGFATIVPEAPVSRDYLASATQWLGRRLRNTSEST